MSLNSFGAILTFAETLETQKYEFLVQAEQSINDDEKKAQVSRLAAETKKQIKLLQRTRRENVTEMILEPVADFSKDAFQLNLDGPLDTVETIIPAVKKSMETTQGFYGEASLKLKALPEVSRALKQLSKKQLKLLNQITTE